MLLTEEEEIMIKLSWRRRKMSWLLAKLNRKNGGQAQFIPMVHILLLIQDECAGLR